MALTTPNSFRKFWQHIKEDARKMSGDISQSVAIIHFEMSKHDGYRKTASGADQQRTSSGGAASSVELAAGELSPLQHDLDTLAYESQQIRESFHRMSAITAKHLPKVAEDICGDSGVGLPGYTEWGHRNETGNIATCHSTAELGRTHHLCVNCRRRKERWERQRSAFQSS
jgi:hypothetical protein